jgi:multidrug transporter EmrE-like cation transporter
MNSSASFQTPPRFQKGMVRFMGLAWLIVGVKCSVIWWAMLRWHVPFHPIWIVAPTIVFAGLATMLWLTHHEE